LEYKESYSKEFLKQTAGTLAEGTYDVRKIEAVLDLLIAECTAICGRPTGLGRCRIERCLLMAEKSAFHETYVRAAGAVAFVAITDAKGAIRSMPY
jgi:hypothetical protein